MNESICIHRRFFDISEYDSQITGLSQTPCNECKEKYKMNEYNVLVVVDKEKTTDLNNPYLTGEVIMIKKECELGKTMKFKNGLAYTFNAGEVYNFCNKVGKEYENVEYKPKQ